MGEQDIMRVYCAGKIREDDWRQELFPQLRGVELVPSREEDGAPRRSMIRPFNGTFEYAGPFWFPRNACGHHRLDLTTARKHYETPYDFNIIEMCLGWIKAADVVFVWLDAPDAYGTLTEIGYAHALGKPIFAYHPTMKHAGRDWVGEMWFALNLADYTRQTDSPQAAFAEFQNDFSWRHRILLFRKMPYERYLQTNHWKKLRDGMLKKAGNRCQLCNKVGALTVHHRTYERLGEELAADLVVLCKGCHGVFHGRIAKSLR